MQHEANKMQSFDTCQKSPHLYIPDMTCSNDEFYRTCMFDPECSKTDKTGCE